MATLSEKTTESKRHCAYCGLAVRDDMPAINDSASSSAPKCMPRSSSLACETRECMPRRGQKPRPVRARCHRLDSGAGRTI